jgi:hypothetical protein
VAEHEHHAFRRVHIDVATAERAANLIRLGRGRGGTVTHHAATLVALRAMSSSTSRNAVGVADEFPDRIR